MKRSETIKPAADHALGDQTQLPDGVSLFFSRQADELNNALLQGFHLHAQDTDIRRTHLFNGRYENIYLNSEHVPELDQLLAEAGAFANQILGIDGLHAGCWFNHMPPGAITTLHSHDDGDELLSAVYYVSTPPNSGDLIIYERQRKFRITPQQGMFVFFAPDVRHEVSENLSEADRLSIAINFGKPGLTVD